VRSIRAGDVTSSRRTPSLQPGILPIISEAALATTTHPPTPPLPPVPVTDLIARHPRWGSRVPLVPEQRVPGFRGLVAVRAGGRRPLAVRPHAGGDLGRAPVA